MGKREVGQLGVIDLIISILIAELASVSIENTNKSLLDTMIPISFLVIIQFLMAYLSLKIPFLRFIFDGNPAVIINRGKLSFKEMTKQRYNLDDLLLQLREKGIRSLEEVEYAILENNGKLSIFEYPREKQNHYFPMPLILDSKIQYDTLNKLNHNERWLRKMLQREEVKLNNVFYAFYKDDKIYIIKKHEVLK